MHAIIMQLANGLQTADCMLVVPAPMVRLPDSHMYMPCALGYGLLPCNDNNNNGSSTPPLNTTGSWKWPGGAVLQRVGRILWLSILGRA